MTYATQFPELSQAAVALKSMSAQVGVDVTIEALENATATKRIYGDKDFDMTLVSYTSYSDPALGIARAFITADPSRSFFGSPSGYSNAEVDALFQKGEHASSFGERGKYYQEAQAILAVDLPLLSLRQYRDVNGASLRLQGLVGRIQGNGDWVNAWLEQ